MDKYYTPDVSDLFVGYECETQVDPYPNWVPTKIEDGDDLNYILSKEWRLRTPYLTKEQIEGEGWQKVAEAKPSRDHWIISKGYGTMEMCYSPVKKTLSPLPAGSRAIVMGTVAIPLKCPSINEFRKICKLIGI